METLDAQTWLAEHGDGLFRFARRPLRSDELAEDAVQQTLQAPLASMDRTRATPPPHLADRVPETQDHRPDPPPGTGNRDSRNEYGDENREALFQMDGHWANAWHKPQAEADLGELRRILNECTDRLEYSMAQVFSLCEGAGMETEEIRKQRGIPSTRFWVPLHRARLCLWECLERNGFAGAISP
jgi:RNA polymerase sigma-70 factor, ECF subfamily